MDSELYLLWFQRIFLKYACKERPLVLIQDGHKSHITLELIDEARKNDVEVICIPPHTTHVVQPLDRVLYGPFKAKYSSPVTVLSYAKKDFIVGKNDIARVLRAPLEETFTVKNIKKSFACTGIYPFDPNAIDKTQLTNLPLQLSVTHQITPTQPHPLTPTQPHPHYPTHC